MESKQNLIQRQSSYFGSVYQLNVFVPRKNAASDLKAKLLEGKVLLMGYLHCTGIDKGN